MIRVEIRVSLLKVKLFKLLLKNFVSSLSTLTFERKSRVIFSAPYVFGLLYCLEGRDTSHKFPFRSDRWISQTQVVTPWSSELLLCFFWACLSPLLFVGPHENYGLTGLQSLSVVPRPPLTEVSYLGTFLVLCDEFPPLLWSQPKLSLVTVFPNQCYHGDTLRVSGH